MGKALIKALSAIASKMKIGLVLACMAFLATANAAVKQLQIGVKHKPADCPITSQNGDMLSMHYTGCWSSDIGLGQGTAWHVYRREAKAQDPVAHGIRRQRQRSQNSGRSHSHLRGRAPQ